MCWLWPLIRGYYGDPERVYLLVPVLTRSRINCHTRGQQKGPADWLSPVDPSLCRPKLGRDQAKTTCLSYMPTEFSGQRPTFTALPNWLRGKTTPLEGWLLWTLQSHYPNIFPSLNTLAEESGMARRTVCNVLGDLERKGWIARKQAYRDDGRRETTRYVLTIWDPHWEQESSAYSALREQAVVHDMHGGSASGAPGVVHQVHGGSASGAHKEEQPKKNKSKKNNLRKKENPLLSPEKGEPPKNEAWQDQQAETLEHAASTPVPGLPGSTQVPTATSNAVPTMPDLTEPPSAPKRRGRPPKAPDFEPTQNSIPTTLLPVQAEILAFWPTKGAAHTERAWNLLLRELQKIQGDPQGGTEAVRQQLQKGRDSSDNGKPWDSITHENWECYGKKSRQQAFSGQPARPRGIKDMSQEEAIRAVEAEVMRREARRHAKTDQGPLQGLLGGSDDVIDVEVVE